MAEMACADAFTGVISLSVFKILELSFVAKVEDCLLVIASVPTMDSNPQY